MTTYAQDVINVVAPHFPDVATVHTGGGCMGWEIVRPDDEVRFLFAFEAEIPPTAQHAEEMGALGTAGYDCTDADGELLQSDYANLDNYTAETFGNYMVATARTVAT